MIENEQQKAGFICNIMLCDGVKSLPRLRNLAGGPSIISGASYHLKNLYKMCCLLNKQHALCVKKTLS